MKNNQTFLAAGILVVLALLYFLTQTGSVDTKSIDSDLFSLDKDAISELELIGSADTLKFMRNDPLWSLDNYPVDTVKMNRLLDIFTDLQVDRLISKNPEKYEKYELTDQSTQFLARGADGTDLLHLIIGQRGANYQETFVRGMSDDEVFAVKASLSQYQNKTPKDFWDRSMTQLDVNQINRAEFKGEMNYALQREGPVWTYNGEQVDFEKVVNMLRPLENLKASNFGTEIGVNNPFYQNIVLGFEDGTSLELNFHLKDANGALLLVRVSGNDKVFEYSKSSLNRFKKAVGDLLPDPVPQS
ncbi:MAG: DUF4340 domain-containing protein [Candidatus Marinimicrobia bacterium]|nr:DUF4340 domain-containing protein [Candidatus Neomarinimicrobiota bacterium]